MSIYNETFSELVLKKKYIYVTLAGYCNILQLSYEYCRTLLSLKATRTIYQLTKSTANADELGLT